MSYGLLPHQVDNFRILNVVHSKKPNPCLAGVCCFFVSKKYASQFARRVMGILPLNAWSKEFKIIYNELPSIQTCSMS
jgi:hypothetical protein